MSVKIPNSFKTLFWDHEFSKISWEEHRDFLIRRILQDGSWDAVTWLRQEIGDGSLRKWIVQHQGRGLNPRQLRFWELVLDLPQSDVNSWIKRLKETPWETRVSR